MLKKNPQTTQTNSLLSQSYMTFCVFISEILEWNITMAQFVMHNLEGLGSMNL